MERTYRRSHQGVFIVVIVILALAVIGSCVISVQSMMQLKEQAVQNAELSNLIMQSLNASDLPAVGPQEEGEEEVKIAQQYWVRSTLAISNAYRSGDTSQLTDTQVETLNMASSVLDEIITEGMTEYEKELAVYDWMCANLRHQSGAAVAGEDYSTPNGVLKNKKAVSVGFATTFRMFLQMMDMECMVIHNAYHAWNLVKLEGEWYHTDVYSDVQRGDYANFNMTDSMCRRGHDWDLTQFPAANGTTYCYAYRNAGTLENIYDLPAVVRDILVTGEAATSYYMLPGGDQRDSWYPPLQELTQRLDEVSRAYMTSAQKDGYVTFDTQAAGDNYLLTVTVSYYQKQVQRTVTEEELAQIDESVAGAFSEFFQDGIFYPGALG